MNEHVQLRVVDSQLDSTIYFVMIAIGGPCVGVGVEETLYSLTLQRNRRHHNKRARDRLPCSPSGSQGNDSHFSELPEGRLYDYHSVYRCLGATNLKLNISNI